MRRAEAARGAAFAASIRALALLAIAALRAGLPRRRADARSAHVCTSIAHHLLSRHRRPRRVAGTSKGPAVIGIAGQAVSVDNRMTGLENLTMFGRLCRLSKKGSWSRALSLLEQFGLAQAAKQPVKSYSGGMRRKLDLAASLIVAPPVLFLDEPTSGLDPASRAALWGTISELAQGGSTVLLTTQYLEEADRLADDIVLVDEGRVVATGAPQDLKARIGGARLKLTTATEPDFARLCTALADLVIVTDKTRRTVIVVLAGPAGLACGTWPRPSSEPTGPRWGSRPSACTRRAWTTCSFS